MTISGEIWKGLAEVRQRSGVKFLGEVTGGFVNIVASAANSFAFRRRVTEATEELGLDLVELDEVQVISSRFDPTDLSEETLEMLRTAQENNSVVFGTFFLFDDHLNEND